MESLWDDFARTLMPLSPSLAQGILDERRQRLADGTSRFIDWETAKADIRNKLS